MLIVTNWKALNIDINDSSMYEVKNGHLEGLFDVDAFGFDKEDLKQLKDGIVPTGCVPSDPGCGQLRV